MSQYMSPPPPPQQTGPPVRQTNTMGIVAFILSAVGLLFGVTGICCLPLGALGILCIIGAILGLIAMRREPRGWAVAGLTVGIVGTIVSVVVIAVMATVVGMGIGMVKQIMETAATIQQSEALIERAYRDDGTMPFDTLGNQIISGSLDAWGNPLRYERLSDSEYDIVSAGPDNVFDTGDDIDRQSANQASARP